MKLTSLKNLSNSGLVFVTVIVVALCMSAFKLIDHALSNMTLLPPHEVKLPSNDIIKLSYSPDGKKIAILDQGENSYLHVRILDVSSIMTKEAPKSKIIIKSIPETEEAPSKSAAFSPDSKFIAIAYVDPYFHNYADQKIEIWEIKTGKIAHRLVIKNTPAVYNGIQQIGYSPDGKYLLLADSYILSIWRTSDWKLIHSLNLKPKNNADMNIVSTQIDAFDISHDSKILATIKKGYEVKLWDIETGVALPADKQILITKRPPPDYYSYARIKFLPDDLQLLIMTSDQRTRTTLYSWDLVKNEMGHSSVEKAADVNAFSCSPNGKYFIINGSPPQVSLWSISSFKKIYSHISGNFQCTDVQFSPDGQTFIASQHDRIKIWDISVLP